MPTKLEKTVKREIEIDGQPYTVAISPEGLKITQKGFRKGQEVSWKEIWTTGNSDEESGSAPGGQSGGMTSGASSGGTSGGSMGGGSMGGGATSAGGYGGSSESGFR
jgi:hypothetical protein